MGRTMVAALVSTSLTLLAVTAASGFEGTVKWREIAVPRHSLSALLPEGPKGGADAVFAVPAERLLSLKKSGNCEVDESTFYVKGSKIRVEGDMGDDPDSYVIADISTGTMWMVMPRAKRYMEWTKADAKAAQQKVGEMKQKVAEQLKALNLPPEQRQQLEAAMAGIQKPAVKPPDLELRPLNKTKTIQGMEAQAYEVKGANETALGWVTKDLRGLAQTMRTWAKTMQENMPPDEGEEDDPGDLLLEQGLPLRIQTLSRKEYRLEEFLSIKQQPVEEAMFSLPAGYEKTTMQQMMQKMDFLNDAAKPGAHR